MSQHNNYYIYGWRIDLLYNAILFSQYTALSCRVGHAEKLFYLAIFSKLFYIPTIQNNIKNTVKCKKNGFFHQYLES